MTAATELFEGAFWRDPYPAYAQLRDDAPVRRLERPDGVIWLVTRAADVRAALVDPRLSKDWRYMLPPDQRAAHSAAPMPMMILMDPPEHTRLRKLVSRVFTLRRMQALQPRVAEIAEQLIAELPASGHVDLLPSFAFPLPVLVICELLGVPSTDQEQFSAWSSAMVDNPDSEASATAARAMLGYLGDLIAAKRAAPDDRLLSALIDDADDDRLSQEELVAMAMLLLIAGHETTVNLIANGMLALLTHPEQRALLQSRPELLPSAVEEFLRWDSPVHSLPARFTAEEVEYAGVTIPAGAMVVFSLAAANRDLDRFPDAAELRVDRDASGHVAFGHGVHHCLGAQLARIEGREAIGAILRARPDIALDVDPLDLVYRQSTFVRGLRSLPVRW